MDDIKRPPKPNLADSSEPNFSSKVSIPISQTSDSITPSVPNRTGPMITPLDNDTPKPPSGPVSLEDLDATSPNSEPDLSSDTDKPVNLDAADAPAKPELDEIDFSKGLDSPAEPESKPEELDEPEAKPETDPSSDLDSSPHVYDPSTNSKSEPEETPVEYEAATPELEGTKSEAVEVKTAAAPETDNKADVPVQPPAPDFSDKKPEVSSDHIDTKSGSLPVSEVPVAPDLSDDKKGKVSQAPTDHPKRKKFSWMAVLVALVLALALAAGAGYAYWQKTQTKAKNPVAQPVEKVETKTDVLTTKDFDELNSTLTKTTVEIKATDESVNSDLTDTGLNL